MKKRACEGLSSDQGSDLETLFGESLCVPLKRTAVKNVSWSKKAGL